MGEAQVYLEKGKNRYTFAQTTVGYDFDFTPSLGSSYFINEQNALEKFYFRNKITPIITITGLHFWGHAEFFTGFSLTNIDIGNAKTNYIFKRSAGTGAKIFPLPLKEKALRPYIGFSISSFKYKNGDAATFRRVEYPILLGLTYSFKRGMLELGTNYYYDNEYTYYISKSNVVPITTPPLSITLDFKYYFDFSMATLKRDQTGETEKIYNRLLAKKRRSSFFIGVGPAYSFVIGKSSYNNSIRPYVDDYKISSIYPDIGIGYYQYKLDAAANISFRTNNITLEGHDILQNTQRSSLALELFKFIGDYHGFVPFIGPIASYEAISSKEKDAGQEVFNKNKEFITYGVIAGWDIRPTRTDWWGIRTNIRYFPNLKINVKDSKMINLNQIELNFLQLIIYPNRISAFKKN